MKLAKNRAAEKRVPLRLRICIEPSARELHSINWEKLTVGDGDGNNPFDPLSTSLARYSLGRGAGWQPAQIRRNAKPSALLLGTSSDGITSTENASALDELDEIAQILGAAHIECTIAKNWYGPTDLAEELRKHGGVDYLYLLVRDCSLAENEALVCEPGAVGYSSGDPGRRGIAESLGELELPPRLVVVAPVPTGARQGESCWPWLLHLAAGIVERGVLGVLTQQQDLEKATWHRFLAPFFAELIEHGQMDQATLTARNEITDTASPWAPVIVSRLRNARLWYHPHFMDESRRDATWDLLLKRIAEGKCTPVIGPGVDYRIARFHQEMARTWAERYQYPLDLSEQVNLPQISQYIVATQGYGQLEQDFTRDLRSFALKRYGHLLDDEQRQNELGALLTLVAKKPLLKEQNDPHIVLASLPFTSYITANFNNFLADALRLRDRPPQEKGFTDPDNGEIGEMTRGEPLVYHLFGQLDDIESLVLTEDQHFGFLIDFSRDRERIPQSVRKALTSSSLLFLGFNLNHWDFRVLFRSLLKLEGNRRRWKVPHVAVQIDPDDDQITNPDRAREYLENYFKEFSESDVSIYWGSSEDFLDELQRRWTEKTHDWRLQPLHPPAPLSDRRNHSRPRAVDAGARRPADRRAHHIALLAVRGWKDVLDPGGPDTGNGGRGVPDSAHRPPRGDH